MRYPRGLCKIASSDLFVFNKLLISQLLNFLESRYNCGQSNL